MKLEKQFSEILHLIKEAKHRAIKSVNTELITLYWQVGEYISNKVESAEWGEAVVDQLAEYINTSQQDLKGFTRRGLYRMRQFYDTYKANENVSTLLSQISWSSHLHIMSKTKTIEEKEFYIHLAIKEKYSVRELERQIDSGYFERYMLSDKKVSTALTQIDPEMSAVFKDTYVLDFLDLPKSYSERDLQKAIILNLKDFILELGKDFTFIAEEHRVQVGNKDFFIDLLFFHRGLQCLVAFELKIDEFKPEYLGKINFYLEALDRDFKKDHENPSVGVLLCTSKDKEVVEYALSRSLSPAMISEYKTKLIDKSILQNKLQEFIQLSKKADID